MEVVTIEKRTFSYVCERFTEFAIERMSVQHSYSESRKLAG